MPTPMRESSMSGGLVFALMEANHRRTKLSTSFKEEAVRSFRASDEQIRALDIRLGVDEQWSY